MELSADVQAQLANLITVSWVLLIPIGVLLVMLLYKLTFFVHAVCEFYGVAKYEIFPILQTTQHTMDNVDRLTTKALAGVENVEKGWEAVTPAMKKTAQSVTDSVGDIRDKAGTLFNLLSRFIGK